MTTKIASNRTKQVTTTEGTAVVVLEADESRMVVTGRIQWRGERITDLSNGSGHGVSRGALRDLAKAILEAVDASEWHEDTAAVEPPAKVPVRPAKDALRGIGDRNKDQAAPAVHELTEDHNRDPVCSCGFDPAKHGAETVNDAVASVRVHVRDSTPRPAGHVAVVQPETKWSVCSCGWIPRFAENRADSERRVKGHIRNPLVDAPAGRPVADRPQA